ncbi:MAG: LUD domain-containing protein [Bacteroidota bacterium]
MIRPSIQEIHPREVANKGTKENLQKAINMALEVENDALRLNTQTFNANRYNTIKKLNDYEELKNRARKIKEQSIENLPGLINKLTTSIQTRGGKVFLAKTKEDAIGYVRDVCKSHSAQLVVKAKSITSEEIGLNDTLEKENIEVSETDLAEFILQVSKEQPSHIVAPAIHRSRERISKLFKENFKTTEKLETGEELTKFARDILRQKFLSADIGISGANLIAANEGTILLVESEGNIRLTTQLPAIHIAIAGVEKIIETKKDFGTFIELLAASGTGQQLTTYTNILEPPLNLQILNLNGRNDTHREFHLVLVDNGRMKMREDKDLYEALYCIRCSACMNVCANFQAVGGHAFGGECYTGGIGGAWTVGTTGKLENGRFAELCTGCSRCIPNCPVKIDIPNLNTVIKNRLLEKGGSSLQKKFFGNFSSLARLTSIIPAISNWTANFYPSRLLFEKVIGFDRRRDIPKFAKATLTRQYHNYKMNFSTYLGVTSNSKKIILFADVYTNYNNPHVGMAIVKLFEKLGLTVSLSKVMEDGRAAQSQGLIDNAANKAKVLANYLLKLIEEGAELLFAEPSVLAMIRHDYKKLINNERQFQILQNKCYDPIEYLLKLVKEGIFDIDRLKSRITDTNIRIFYHGHCQMKSIGIGNATPNFLQMLGFEVDVSTVECCGMAGSFGYKKQYYDLSKNVGKDLAKQVKKSQTESNSIILASGTSCREQIKDEIEEEIYHPMEFLLKVIQ